MAPDGTLGRLQLGKATFRIRRPSLRSILPFVFLLTILVTCLEAKDQGKDSWGRLSPAFLVFERPSVLTQPLVLSSLPPASEFLHAFPAGRATTGNRILIPDHPSIDHYIRYYEEGSGRKTLLKAMERSWSFFPIMKEILETHGVPPEMVYVALVESCFQGDAFYRGAGGYWQLLAPTARMLGLRVDRWVDERRDPVRSTQAAARYLSSLYGQLHSWPLAMAAYNAGIGPVNSGMKRCGTKDFWKLTGKRALPAVIRQYVPKVFAAIQVMRDLESQGFKRPSHLPLYDFESLWVEAPLALEQVARWLDIPLADVRQLNPALTTDQMPSDSGFLLRLPSGARDKFDLAYEMHFGSKPDAGRGRP